MLIIICLSLIHLVGIKCYPICPSCHFTKDSDYARPAEAGAGGSVCQTSKNTLDLSLDFISIFYLLPMSFVFTHH